MKTSIILIVLDWGSCIMVYKGVNFMKFNDIETALKIFEEAATKQAEATEKGDYKAGNKYYNKLIEAASFLKNKNAIGTLQSYLDSSFIGVRLWSAYYLLSICEKKAAGVLEEISIAPGIHSLTAKTTLNEWKKGSLKF